MMADTENQNERPQEGSQQPVIDDGTLPPPQEKARHKGIYLLPNLFTTGAMFAGFYAILAGMDGNFEAASIAIFVAMIFDGLDGTVAPSPAASP